MLLSTKMNDDCDNDEDDDNDDVGDGNVGSGDNSDVMIAIWW